MKKTKWLSLALCLLLTLQCLTVPALAAETAEDSDLPEPTAEDSVINAENEAAFGTVSIQQGCRTLNGMVPLGGSDRKLETAQGVFLYEVKTNTVIYSYNADLKLAPGNLAKMVTALLALEMCNEDDIVTVNSANISKLPAGSLNKNLKHDEQLSVRDLVYCMLLEGANDAAIAIAEHVAGTQQAFVTLMNARVKQMGCGTTEFANVHGLTNATSYSTARDITKIAVECLKNEEFKKIFGEAKYDVPATNRTEKPREPDHPELHDRPAHHP